MKLSLTIVGALSLAAACGGKDKGAPTGPGNSGGGDVAGPPYAALFQDGKDLRYRRVSKSSMYDPDDPKATPDGQVVDETVTEVKCKVAARELGAIRVAQITCEGGAEGDSLFDELTAVYVADARGVWRAIGQSLPADEAAARALATSETGKPLLAPSPVADEQKKEDEQEGFGEMVKTSQDQSGAWCHEWGSWGGDEGGGGVCFGAGRGLTKVSSYFAGGMVRDDWFELVP